MVQCICVLHDKLMLLKKIFKSFRLLAFLIDMAPLTKSSSGELGCVVFLVEGHVVLSGVKLIFIICFMFILFALLQGSIRHKIPHAKVLLNFILKKLSLMLREEELFFLVIIPSPLLSSLNGDSKYTIFICQFFKTLSSVLGKNPLIRKKILELLNFILYLEILTQTTVPKKVIGTCLN